MVDPSGVDPNTIVGAGLIALASKDMLNRLLGPTADYIGGEVKGLVEKCNVNLGRIFDDAVKKLGRKIEEPGAVNPRVLKQVWSEGAFIEDELAAEYFGGLLASARSGDGKDDRMLMPLAAIRDLSVYDMKLHFLVYSLMRAFFVGSELWVSEDRGRSQMGIYIPFRVYTMAAGVQDSSEPEQLAGTSLFRLAVRDLIGQFAAGSDGLIEHYDRIEEPGIVVYPSYFGAELFLLAHGHTGVVAEQFVDPSLPTSSHVPMTMIEGSRPIKDWKMQPPSSSGQ